MTEHPPFRCFKTGPEIIRLAVTMSIRFPLSFRNVEDLLHERATDICRETVRFRWHRFGPLFAAEIRRRRVEGRHSSHWRWLLDDVFVRINGERHYLWRAVDHEGEVLKGFMTNRRDKKAALKFLRTSLRRHGHADDIVTDRLFSYGAALREPGSRDRQRTGPWAKNRVENSHQPFRRRQQAMLRFRRMHALRKFAAVHASVFNHFNRQRSHSPTLFKQTRSPLSPRVAASAPNKKQRNCPGRDEFALV